jgi:tripartite-type tricarboxylate transporter receptor subunit TctC
VKLHQPRIQPFFRQETSMHALSRRSALLALASMAGASTGAFGQAFPSRPSRLIVGFPPGGGTDTLARLVAQSLADKWAQPVVVDNRPGANMIIGLDAVAKSAPDGYTIGMAATPLVANSSLYSKVPYDAVKDLTYITLLTRAALVLVVNNSVPANNLQELLALARKEPGMLSYASGGTGGSPHLAGALMESMGNVKLLHVPFKGAGPAVTDLIAGRVTMMFSDMPQFEPLIKAGKVKVIAASTARRSPALPDLPTLAESGLPGYDVPVWYGLIGPAGMPREAVTRIAGDARAVLALPAVREKLAGWGYEPVGSTPDEFLAFSKGEMTKWSKVIKEANIRLD